MKLPTMHEIALRQMFRTETTAWYRWLDRVKVDWWAVRW